MLPLSAETTPTTIHEFSEALARGWQKLGVIPRHIEAEGTTFPALDALRVDMTGASLTRDFEPARATADNDGMVNIAHFELVGAPIYFEKTALEVRLAAERVRARMELHGAGLIMEEAAAGTVSVRIDHQALESLLH